MLPALYCPVAAACREGTKSTLKLFLRSKLKKSDYTLDVTVQILSHMFKNLIWYFFQIILCT